jgi:predicted O-linked N-acetylglucosamine transferase (SPINDLY family)
MTKDWRMPSMPIAELIGTAQRLTEAGQAALAVALYREWAARNGSERLLHVAHFNRGVLLSALGDLAGAADAFGEAIRHDPAFLPPYINLGSVYERVGAMDHAMAQWRHVADSLATVTPDSLAWKLAALKQLAQALESRRQLSEAEAVLRQIVELAPGEQDALQHWISLRQRQCAWPVLEPLASWDGAGLLRRMAPLSLANHLDDPMLQLAAAHAYTRETVGWPAEARTTESFDPARRGPGDRLRIGYLSSDLREHAIGHLMAEMLGLHDRDTFDISVYHCGIPQVDATRQRVHDSVEHWTSITELDDAAALARILADGIDILIDVNGHTRGARTRLLLHRPAPVIVNWLGFPGSMGSPVHHYIIADPVIIPPEQELYYSEAVRRLPCYQPNDRQRAAATAPTRSEAGLPPEGTVFCSFNGTQKITPAVFARWMTILRDVPGSVLWQLRSNDVAEQTLRTRAAEAGIAPERLVFAPLLPHAEHLARYALADLFLDTSPYGAHTTASDALWAGVPVLTVPGHCFASRICASLVRAAGVPETIAETPDEYVRLAIALGRDPSGLLTLRRRLHDARAQATLFDTPGLVRALEDLFRAMWQDFAAGQLPRPDLSNLDTYLDLGVTLHSGPQGTEMGLEAGWAAALARRHAYAPLPQDGRLWRNPVAPDLRSAA